MAGTACLLLLLIGTFAATVHGFVCTQCGSAVTGASEVMTYCKQNNLTLTSNQRCCVNSTADNITDTSVVGVDLRNCNLQNVTNLFNNISSVVVISLEDNPLTAVALEDFYGLTELNYLSVPGKVAECPGGADAWEESKVTNSTRICQTQVNTCLYKENNDTCPSPQSYCVPAGPGIVDCLCSADYHGYKCLRKGTFPLVSFVSGISASTVASAVFLWVTQRRFVKKGTCSS